MPKHLKIPQNLGQAYSQIISSSKILSYLKICLHHVGRNVYILFENMFYTLIEIALILNSISFAEMNCFGHKMSNYQVCVIQCVRKNCTHFCFLNFLNKQKMLTFKWLPCSILAISWSKFHQIILKWISLESTQKGLLKNVKDGISRPLGSREIQKTKVCTVLPDTL